MRAVITVGCPASGKTKWAEDLVRYRDNWVNISRDAIRFSDGYRDYYNYKFKSKKEKAVTKACEDQILLACKMKKNIIISDTNLDECRRDALVKKLKLYGYDVELKWFHVELRELIARDQQREGGVGQSTIMRMYLQMNGKEYTPEDGEHTYVFDIDGTVALSDPAKRGWYDWHLVGTDSVNTHVMEIAKALAKSGYHIIFLSGRDGVCRQETTEWLSENFGYEFELFMREPGDQRRDSIIKKELFDENIKDMYNVFAFFDDRPQVIKETWLPLGVNVVCIGNPYIDF